MHAAFGVGEELEPTLRGLPRHEPHHPGHQHHPSLGVCGGAGLGFI